MPAYSPFHNCPYVVIPAEAGIQRRSGCRITSGMTGLFRYFAMMSKLKGPEKNYHLTRAL